MTTSDTTPDVMPAVTLSRETRETQIRVMLAMGSGRAEVDTAIPFLDHVLVTFARYAGLDLTLQARGDLRHHTIEDVAIVVGAAVARLLPATAARYGDRTIPMDDALVHACLDLGGRPFYQGPLPSRLYDHWMRSFADNARATLHLRVLRGTDRHHIVEAGFKALGLAVRDAFVETGAVFSTKGSVSVREGSGLEESGSGEQGADGRRTT
ncbi:MAG TPA: imidazoleglycerol-phosphate dehydratase [Gemmatimonadaceae bacterium]|nr:imidazoleglycerol-phosphate dehydratase [Gemmatimonadaceae bacterium]